jgi:hypothetical protein
MENICRLFVRHLIFMGLTFLFLYIVALTFTAPVNFTTWSIDACVIFSTLAHVCALFVHGYFLDRYA